MFIVFCVLFVINFHSITSSCLYKDYDGNYPPVFTQNFDSKEIIIRPHNRSLLISDGSFFKAYCDTNFSSAISEEARPCATTVIECYKEVLYYGEINEKAKVESFPKLSCYDSQPAFFKTDSLPCRMGRGMVYGLEVDQKQIVLSTFCYDIEKMDIIHIHYENAGRLTMIENSASFRFDSNNKLPINFFESNLIKTEELNSHFHKKSPNTPNLQLYKFDQLVPSENLVKGFTYQTEVLEGPTSIPWWINLKEGNWKQFENLLEKELLSRKYDVYTGILHHYKEPVQEIDSGITYNDEYVDPRYKWNGYPSRGRPDYGSTRPSNYPSKVYEHDLNYMSGSTEKTIPLYVWSYVKPRNTADAGIVVIGINSPFVDLNLFRTLAFCSDSCQNTRWLRDLDTAKMPALGYIFCCQPEAARKYIIDLP